jgi:hypothetical protein
MGRGREGNVHLECSKKRIGHGRFLNWFLGASHCQGILTGSLDPERHLRGHRQCRRAILRALLPGSRVGSESLYSWEFPSI